MFDFKFEDLELKQYNSLLVKENMINKIKAVSFTEENGITKIDFITKELFTVLIIFLEYTNKNINLYVKNENDEEVLDVKLAFELYDYIVSEGIFDDLVNKINDISSLFNMLNQEIEQELKIKNSIEGILAKTLNRAIDVLEKNTNPKEMKKILTQLNKTDLSKLPMLQKIVDVVQGNS